MKVIGSGNEDFVSGQTDLRGVFVADGIRGGATVIALAGPSRYAFYRAKESAISAGELAMAIAAQTGPGAAAPGRGPAVSLYPHSEGRDKIEAALKEPTQLEFVKTPLTDVVDFLKEHHKIEIQLDKNALSDVGIGTDTPITKNLSGVSLKSALRLMLRELGLTYFVKDDVLLITTPEQAESTLETRVYPVGDLVIPPEANMAAPNGSQPGPVPAGAQADFDSLIDLITSTAKPTSWDEVGGPGSIKALSTNLTITVSQTQEVHEEIETLLQQLRQASRESGGPGLPMLRPRATSSGGRPNGGRVPPGMGGGMFGSPAGMAGGMGPGMAPGMGGPNAPARAQELLLLSLSRPTSSKASSRRTRVFRASSPRSSTKCIRTAAARTASAPARRSDTGSE